MIDIVGRVRAAIRRADRASQVAEDYLLGIQLARKIRDHPSARIVTAPVEAVGADGAELDRVTYDPVGNEIMLHWRAIGSEE